MFQLVKNYVSSLTKEKLNTILVSKGINLSDSELDYLYRFIRKNYEALYVNPNIDLTKYKSNFSDENFDKIINLVKEYKIKYASFLS